ncbi:VOC family protein [Gulosibacter molinativorax]|uniref:Glyoxalase n=1 Tax=Gulosibacter molinativorax TaxID=256821 RepID=A0ABT7CDC4_9MICO|nr:VOC family protein [Gulosibacter molinativorax]MDJ1372627.1 glyoxalase [Gulosibacter molinativorax]QUY62589.1 Iron-dependent extradiol dioxygenase [Gulosibacter molinativorax]
MNKPNRLTLVETEHAGALRKTAVSHIGFRVPDVDATTAFYNRVLGLSVHERLDNGAVRLGWGTGHHVIELVEGEQGLNHYGFEVRDEGGLEGIRSRLEAAGHTVEDLAPEYVDAAIGKPAGIVVVDPDGTPVHFHSIVERQGENAADTGRRPIKFQHTTVGTVDVKPFVDFFVNTIGFRITDQLADGKFTWFRSDKDHHTLAVVEVGRGGDIDHYSYDLAEWEDFKAWCDRLTELDVDVAWGPGRHGPGNNLFVFFDDPAGNHIELSAEMEKFYDETVEYVPRRWEPIPNSVNLWGGQLPNWRKTSEEKK